jgi:hypothetical protein
VHSSLPNNADYRRIGYSIHYCPTHVRETMYDPVDGKKSAALVRGVDEYNYWDPEPETIVEVGTAFRIRLNIVPPIYRVMVSRNV